MHGVGARIVIIFSPNAGFDNCISKPNHGTQRIFKQWIHGGICFQPTPVFFGRFCLEFDIKSFKLVTFKIIVHDADG